MTGLAISKPWALLTDEAIAALPAQLGVFEVGDKNESTIRIGYAGGREPFGLRSALSDVLAAETGGAGRPLRFRYELTHAYQTRWEELLMIHKATTGTLPVENQEHPHKVGRLHLD